MDNYNTLIACLPNESKEILYKNQIIISTPTSKPPLFNYVEFIKSLSINEIVENHLQPMTSQKLDDNKMMVIIRELFKMFMNQISLKKLNFYYGSIRFSKIPFTTYPGAMNCLRNLSELNCDSDVNPEFFYHLSQICHNIQSLDIMIEGFVPNGLSDLISVQQSLKFFSIFLFHCENLTETIPILTNLPSTIIKLDLYGGQYCIPLSFITKFTSLRELILSFYYDVEEFEILQHVTFPQLEIFKINYKCPNHKYLTKFLENNGINLKELYIDDNDMNSLDLAKFCLNM